MQKVKSAEGVIKEIGYRFSDCEQIRRPYYDLAVEIADLLLPHKKQYLRKANNNTNTIDLIPKSDNSAAFLALRTFVQAYAAATMSPNEQWFGFGLIGDEGDSLEEKGKLAKASNFLMEVRRLSNFYPSVGAVLLDAAAFGTGLLISLPDDATKRYNPEETDLIRYTHVPFGQYYLRGDEQNRICAVKREISMTARNIVRMFGEKNCPDKVKTAYQNNGGSSTNFTVCHAIEQNDFDDVKYNGNKSEYASIYYVQGEKTLLQFKQYACKPFAVMQFDKGGADIYSACPMHYVMKNIRELDWLAGQSQRNFDLSNHPYTVGSSAVSRKMQEFSDRFLALEQYQTGGKLVEQLFQVPQNQQEIAAREAKLEQAIKEAYFYHIFMAMNMETRSGLSATEAAAKNEEVMLLAGDLYESAIEFHNSLLKTDYIYLAKAGAPNFDQAPAHQVKIIYKNKLQQSLNSNDINRIERFVGFIGNVAATSPEAIKKINIMEAVDDYGMALNINPKMINSNEDVEAMMQSEQQQQAAQSVMENAGGLAQAGRVMAETDAMQPTNIMDEIAGLI